MPAPLKTQSLEIENALLARPHKLSSASEAPPVPEPTPAVTDVSDDNLNGI